MNDKKYKYKLLNDYMWLYEKYINELLSTTDISKLIGCTKDAVRVALIRNDIKLRNAKESNEIRINRKGCGSAKYNLLNNKEWLEEKYLKDKLSTVEISKIVKSKSGNSVRQALIRNSIVLRDRSESATCKRIDDGFLISKDNESVFNGCMLGDAGLYKSNKHNNRCYVGFYKKNIHLEHINYVGSLLFNKPFENMVKLEISKEGHKCFVMRSLSHKELIPYYEKWYPVFSGYKKVVPTDLKIDETVLLHWFLDDGCSYYSKKSKEYEKKNWKMRKLQVKIVFCSQSFTKEDQQILCDKINDKFQLGAKLTSTNSGTGWIIKISQKNANKFFDILGNTPVNKFAYKWKRSEII